MVRIDDWSYATILAAEPRSAREAREFVCVHLIAHDLPHLVDDIRLVVSELAANAVAHARTPFRVTLSRVSGLVRLAVQDESPSVPAKSEPGDTDECGRGLLIVELLSTEWGATTDGAGLKSVWASFRAADTMADGVLA
jgi:anti-sigma regulatory factor (Ser/Thr protein kinase)